MTRDEIENAIRDIDRLAKALTNCGAASIERRATQVLTANYCLVWSELPFESCDLLVEWEVPHPAPGSAPSDP